MSNYSNRMTVVFEGIETEADGRQYVVRSSTVMAKDDTWPELLQTFMMGLKGAGYYPDLDTAVEALTSMFPSEIDSDDWDCDHLDDDTECANCENNPANYPA